MRACRLPGWREWRNLRQPLNCVQKWGVGRSFSGGHCGRGARKAADERLLAIVALHARLFLVVLDGFVAEDVDKFYDTL